jgi:hypothetical protein
MADGLNAAQAARAVGVARATLYRWAKTPVPRSRRPHRCRRPAFTPAMIQAVVDLRALQGPGPRPLRPALDEPQLNGAVERSQSSGRYEFYACFDLPHRIHQLQRHVDAFAYRYNHHRPHQALADLTPVQYLSAITISQRSSIPAQSHMS